MLPALASNSIPGQRRSAGGARHEASERVLLRIGAQSIEGWTLNTSRGGARIVLEGRVAVSQELELELADAPSRPARVVWARDQTDGQIIGVEYLDLPGSVPPPG